MTKQEEIREYFESRLCSDWLQEYCSGCTFSRKAGDYCKGVKKQISNLFVDLSELGVVIKVGDVKAITIAGQRSNTVELENIALVEPLIGGMMVTMYETIGDEVIVHQLPYNKDNKKLQKYIDRGFTFEKPGPIFCPECGKECKSEFGLSVHMRVHNGDKNKDSR